MPTYCSECENCRKDSKSAPEYTWTCSKFPRLEQGFLAPNLRDSNLPPYMLCRGINGGVCCLFTPKREAKNENRDSVSKQVPEGK